MSSLKCDVTGSTDRVQPLPLYMQTEKIKKVCFRVAVQMERERIEGKPAPAPEQPVVQVARPKKKASK